MKPLEQRDYLLAQKMNKLDEVNDFNKGIKLIYEWTKTGHINRRQFTQLIMYLTDYYLD